MPIYTFRCQNCKFSNNSLMSMSEKEKMKTPTQCPKCGELQLYIIPSRSSFSLKGSGWYKDGYNKKGD